MKETRVKLFIIGCQEIVMLFNAKHAMMNRFLVVASDSNSLPENAVVEAVQYDFQRDAFVLRISHESFPIVQPGDLIPYADEFSWRTRFVEFKSLDEQEAAAKRIKDIEEEVEELRNSLIEIGERD